MLTRSAPLAREGILIIVLLLGLAAASWIVLLRMSETGSSMTGLTMGMSAALFLAVWVVMMIAMMFPTAAPMIVMYSTVARGKRDRGQAFVPTWVFVGAYLAIWSLSGVLAFAMASGAERAGSESMWLMSNAGRIGGAVLILAGLYQFSPLKRACLSKCRSPIQFILNSWRDGYGGAVRMGVEHGSYCLGCCWMLFVILFPLGIMNVAAMAMVTVLIFAEKSLSAGHRIGQISAIALIALGAIAVFVPSVLPGTMA